MEITSAIITGAVVTIVFLLTAMPLGFAIGLGAVVMAVLGGVPVEAGVSRGFDVLLSDPLLAIPFFILAGDLMKEGLISKYLLDFSCFLFGRVRGTLGHVMIITMAFFGAITGSAVATVAAIGSFMIPRMVEEGYDLRYARHSCRFWRNVRSDHSSQHRAYSLRIFG